MNWLKRKIRSWLGVEDDVIRLSLLCRDLIASHARLSQLHKDLVSIGVDVHFKTPSMILIYSHLQGGQIRHIDANFESMVELNEFVKCLKEQFMTKAVMWDAPGVIRDFINYP
jgi:hypothetical protein